MVKFREKTVENILKAIEESKKVPFERVLYALGIRYVGEATAKILAQKFKNIDNLINSSYEELLNTEEIGEKIANSIKTFFSNPENINLINRLKSKGLQFEVKNETYISSSELLKGKSFVVSGNFGTPEKREEIKKLVINNGGKIQSSVNSKTNYIIAGENMGPEKLKKAVELNIPIINENEFFKMISYK